MHTDTWSVAFTISVDGIEVDITEISDSSRMEIAVAILNGVTEGRLSPEENGQLNRAAS